MPFPPDGPRLPAATTLPLRGVTVLAVEDSRFSSDALRLILTRAGARLRRVETLAAARLHLECYRPDLVIADLGLPDGRGEELIAVASARGIPVLAVSGDPDGRQSALDAGAVAFFEKPIPSVAGFLRLVQQLLTGTGAEAEAVAVEAGRADPMALRDDLARAAALVTGAADAGYVAGFVRGLARSIGDRGLEEAAVGAGEEGGRQLLAQVIGQRLMAMQSV
ncbi:response regulator [Tabrizicola aquatica]|uniref:response regulator n=1 Tax=Tabrizicola aquatica TaxID=909926 RepID=UPI000CD27046|nr:response regulator [Tabrizicola aquatica]